MKIENRLITKRERFFIYTLFFTLLISAVYWLHNIKDFLDSYASVFGYDSNKNSKIFVQNDLSSIIGKEFISSLLLFFGSYSIFYSSQKKTLFGFLFSSFVLISICSIMIFILKSYMF